MCSGRTYGMPRLEVIGSRGERTLNCLRHPIMQTTSGPGITESRIITGTQGNKVTMSICTERPREKQEVYSDMFTSCYNCASTNNSQVKLMLPLDNVTSVYNQFRYARERSMYIVLFRPSRRFARQFLYDRKKAWPLFIRHFY